MMSYVVLTRHQPDITIQLVYVPSSRREPTPAARKPSICVGALPVTNMRPRCTGQTGNLLRRRHHCLTTTSVGPSRHHPRGALALPGQRRITPECIEPSDIVRSPIGEARQPSGPGTVRLLRWPTGGPGPGTLNTLTMRRWGTTDSGSAGPALTESSGRFCDWGRGGDPGAYHLRAHGEAQLWCARF